PEGAWGSTTSTSTVSKESLLEADAIPAIREPLTLQQKIVRVVTAAAVLGVLFWGGMQGWSWWGWTREQGQLKVGLDYAAGENALKQLGPTNLAALQTGLGDYYRRTRKPGCAPQARLQYEKALGLLQTPSSAGAGEWDHDLVLVDLAL